MPLSLCIKLFIFCTISYSSNSQYQSYQVKPYDQSALIGSNITIPCVITLPHGDVQWTKDGLALGYDRQLPGFPTWSIIGDETQGEYNFFIESLKFDDEGIFACEVSPYNNAPALKQIAHIKTLVQPEHVQINDQSSTTETTIVTMRYDEKVHHISCRVDGARPAALIKWFNETIHDIPATSRLYVKDNLFSTVSTLTIIPSLLLDKKHFTCDVQHETLSTSTNLLRKSVEIRITTPPSNPFIHGYSGKYRLLDGSFLNLTCQSYGGQPLGRLLWYRIQNDTAELVNNSTVVYDQSNTIESSISMRIKSSDNNVVLSCHVINDYLHSIGQTFYTNITLQVAFGPSSVHIFNDNMNTTTITEGQPQQFYCRASSSSPSPVIVWKFEGQTLPADSDPLEELAQYSGTTVQSTKTIGSENFVRKYHKKLLSCEARNPETGHTVVNSIQLNVIHNAISIEMYGIAKNTIINSGDKVTANCVLIGGNPLGKILWYRGDELLDSEYVIEAHEDKVTSRVDFIAAPSDNNLFLTCRGQVENFPPHIASFILNVTFLPMEITIIENERFANLSMDTDEDREFECRTSKSNPRAHLTVMRQSNDGEKYFDIQYKTQSTYIDGINSIRFTLPSVDLSLHQNTLICEAVLDLDVPSYTKHVTYALYVNHKPYFHHFNNTIIVKENQSFNITLQANAYPMPISYTWFHPSGRQLMNDQFRIFVDDGQLSLLNIQRHDFGVYRCVAANSIGYTEVNLTLNVQYGPVITRTQGYSVSEALMPGSSAILSCVIDGNPIDLNHVRWLKDNQEISVDQWEKRIELNTISLIRKSIHREDAGLYGCAIENSFGSTHATLPLIVQYGPEIDRSNPSYDKAAIYSDCGLTAEIHCFVSAIPTPTVIWTKDNQLLVLPSPKYQTMLAERIASSSFVSNLEFDAILYVNNVTKADYGIYQCKIENKLGIDQAQIVLTGLTIPDPPTHIQVINASYSSVVINWKAGFDGGAPQTFQLRYRLSTDSSYTYENVPSGQHSFYLKNLKLASIYYVSMRSNNSHHLSKWTDEILIPTSKYLPSLKFHTSEMPSKTSSFTLLTIITTIGLFVVFVNVILIILFIIKRRRSNMNGSDNSSTTGTNETEANTVDIFQPIPSNFFLTTNTYKKYDDDDIKRPFVSTYPATNTPLADNKVIYANLKKNHISPYDNIRSLSYCQSSGDNNLGTYRSFNDGIGTSIDAQECVRTDLV